MQLFLLILRSSWLTGIISVLLGAASGLASLSLITLIHQAISGDKVDVSLGMYFAAACIAVMVSQIASKRILLNLSQSTSARLQYELCLRTLSAPMEKLEKVGPSQLLGVISGDVGTITNTLIHFPAFCANIMVLVCGISYLAYLSIPLAMWTFVVSAFGVATYMLGIRLANVHLRQAREDADYVGRQFHALAYGLKELKSNNERSIDFIYDALLPADTKMRERSMKGITILDFTNTWGRLYVFVGIGALVFIWPLFWEVSPAALTGYILTILYLTNPLEAVLGWLPHLNGAMIAMNKIREFGLEFDHNSDPVIAIEQPKFESLEMTGIRHTYLCEHTEEPEFVLGPLDLSVTCGEVLFIAGGNGSGKTTLAKLLTGLYSPQEGQVFLNNQEVDDEARGNYRQMFATVFVEGHLFDRLLGIEVDNEQLLYWLDKLNVRDKVDVEKRTLEMNSLSRGQKKRLALLVACLEDRPIFVFDEWAAEQDPSFKTLFYRGILPELKSAGKTVICITHDDRFFADADRVVKLSDGRIESMPKLHAA